MARVGDKRTDRMLHWQAQVAGWRRSGLSQSEYWRRQGVSRDAFVYWKDKFQGHERGGLQWVEVPVADAVRGFPDRAQRGLLRTVKVNRYRVQVPWELDPSSLAQLIAVLERL